MHTLDCSKCGIYLIIINIRIRIRISCMVQFPKLYRLKHTQTFNNLNKQHIHTCRHKSPVHNHRLKFFFFFFFFLILGRVSAVTFDQTLVLSTNSCCAKPALVPWFWLTVSGFGQTEQRIYHWRELPQV